MTAHHFVRFQRYAGAEIILNTGYIRTITPEFETVTILTMVNGDLYKVKGSFDQIFKEMFS